MFDAGAIEARLTVRTDEFDRKLREAEDRVRRFEDKPHKVRISAVFDTSDMGKARRMFQQLDRTLSHDAANRLRTSPQGSVLGALNALFSPHPVTGAPTASQSGQQGLLGKMISGAGGGTGQAQNRKDVIKDVIGVDDKKARAQGAKAGREAADAAAAEAGAEARKRRGLFGGLFGDIFGGQGKASEAAAKKEGGKAGKDAADAAASSAEKEAKKSGLARGLLGFLGFGGGGGKDKGATPAYDKGLLGGIGPGIMGISGKGALFTGLGASALGAVPALLGVAGTLGIGAAGGGLIALGAKELIGTKNVKGKPPTQGVLYNPAQQVAKVAESTFKSSASALVGPLKAAFAQIPQLLKGIGPLLRQAFAGAGTLVKPLVGGIGDLALQVLPALAKAFRAVAPLLRPLIDGIGLLLGHLLPGITTLLKSAGPAIQAFAQALGILGTDLGKLFADGAPVIKASAVIMKALLDVISGLFPVIGKLAQIFATSLAPVFRAFAGIIKALMPFFVQIGHVIASLASAVLGDLVYAFQGLVRLLTAIQPALATFAKAFEQVFNVLENTGTFAILGDALHELVPALAKMINALARGLAPILPPVIKFIGDLSNLLITGLVKAVITLLPVITRLAVGALSVLAKILPVILPLILKFTQLFTNRLVGIISQLVPPLLKLANAALAALAVTLPVVVPLLMTMLSGFTGEIVTAVSGVASALSALVSAVPPGALAAIAGGLLALKGISIVTGLLGSLRGVIASLLGPILNMTADMLGLDTAMDANVVGAVVLALAALGTAAYELYKHWATVWGAVKTAAHDAWNFIWNGFGKYLLPLLGPAGLIALGAIELARHWSTVTADITGAAKTLWHYLWDDFGAKIKTFFTATLPGWATTLWNGIKAAFGNIETAIGAVWTWLSNTFGANIRNFFTVTVPGWATGLYNGVKAAFGNVVTFAAGIPDKIINALAGLAGDLAALGKGVIGGLYDGIKSAISDVGSWINNHVVQPVIKAVKHFFGIHSPSAVMAGLGGHVVSGFITGLITGSKGLAALIGKVFGSMPKALLALAEKGLVGLKNLPSKALSALKSLGSGALSVLKGIGGAAKSLWDTLFGGGGKVSGTVGSWIAQALKIAGMPASWAGLMGTLVSKESGGNPKAVNPQPVADGEHAEGIAQTIPSTFAAYRMAGHRNIWNPVDDLIASVRYIAAVWGSPGNIPGLTGGAYKGYSGGGWLTEPVLGWGVNTGTRYALAEREAEYVSPGSRLQAAGAASQAAVLSRLDRLITATEQVPAGVGRHVGAAFGSAAQAASFRSRYPRGGA